MSRVDLSSAGFSKASLPNGMLQTDSALNTTLQTVKDNVGNSSTLLLSTVDAQFNSTVRIHTDSSELLDIEDTGANNRFNINRVVQQINLDFASKPTDLTTIVGAIRTAQDGVNLSNALYFRENGQATFTERVGIESDSTVATQTSAVIQATTTNANLVLSPNGTGAIVASIPDGTATGGNARGANAVDLQTTRTASDQVAGASQSVILGGQNNKIITNNIGSNCHTIVGGTTNTIQTTTASPANNFIGGGDRNTINLTASGNSNTIAGGQLNTIGGGGTGPSQVTIGGGASNTASSNYSTVSGGQLNTASTNTHATVVGGSTNTASGQYSTVSGQSNTVSGLRSAIFGGSGNVLSGTSSSMIASTDSSCAGSNNSLLGGNLNLIGNGTSNSLGGGRSNSINNNVDYSFLGGGQSNVISGASGGADWGVIVGGQSNTIENTYTSILGGNNNYAFGLYSSVLGTKDAYSYLYGSVVLGGGLFSTRGDAQQSLLTARNSAALATGSTLVLSLDGTGTTNLIIPNGTNRAWNVTIKTVALVTTITGTATGVTVGDAYSEVKYLLFKKVGGTSSIVGTVDTSSIKSNTSMSTCAVTITAGASQEMAITFTAPTFAGGGTVTCRVVSKIELTEVAY